MPPIYYWAMKFIVLFDVALAVKWHQSIRTGASVAGGGATDIAGAAVEPRKACRCKIGMMQRREWTVSGGRWHRRALLIQRRHFVLKQRLQRLSGHVVCTSVIVKEFRPRSAFAINETNALGNTPGFARPRHAQLGEKPHDTARERVLLEYLERVHRTVAHQAGKTLITDPMARKNIKIDAGAVAGMARRPTQLPEHVAAPHQGGCLGRPDGAHSVGSAAEDGTELRQTADGTLHAAADAFEAAEALQVKLLKDVVDDF
ncbi:hypothetical protein PWT90_02644 [Aphanocladium album]|nr:hypothetical protein PWT90_02644 [Aphanocladium album]